MKKMSRDSSGTEDLKICELLLYDVTAALYVVAFKWLVTGWLCKN
jgi:hypothetical protein